MPETAVIFDLDDTLIVEVEVARASLRKTALLLPEHDPTRVEGVVLATARARWRAGPCYRLCLELGIASWEGLWSTFEGNHADLDELRRWGPGYRAEVWRASLAELGVDLPRLADQMSDTYVRQQHHGHPLVDGAGALVRSLAGTGRLGLLTNGPADIQRLKFDGTGLADCFDAVCISGALGIGKPDPAVFAHALDQLGAAPATTTMVGDSWERDIVGAVGAGMPAVWLAGGRPVPAELPGVTVAEQIGDLSALLR